MRIYLIITGVLTLIALAVFTNASDVEDKYSWTKAVCDDRNYCVDVILECENGRIKDVGMTGAAAYFGPEWEDPRPLEFREAWC